MARCREYLAREWDLLADLRAVLVLGKMGQDALLAMLREKERVPRRKAFAFGHGVVHDLGGGLKLFGSYHPSQQNTFTGKLKPANLDAVLAAVNRHLGLKAPGGPER
jgi:uracil-DNA glycosylase